MNILITNAVPLNGGDEALLRGLLESLRQRWPESSVTVLCSDLELARQQVPDLTLASDLEFAQGEALRRTRDLYRRADLVLSAPGGFLHDFYPLQERLRGFEVALALRKPLLLLGQSLGPFWKPESLRRIPEVLNRAACVCVRDQASCEHLLRAGVNPDRIRSVGDVSFLWHRLAPELFRAKSGPIRRVGLCFRVWPPGDTVAAKETLIKASQLCRFLLADPERELLFVSTCQGIPTYVDDSELARLVVEQLPLEFRRRCRLDSSRLGPRELIRVLGETDAFIGMRLHGCILSMLAGTPAMGLGYEQKTEDIFRQCGLESYQLGFTQDAQAWLKCAERFLAELPRISARLPEILEQAAQRAELNLQAIADLVSEGQAAGQARPRQPQSEWKELVKHYDVPHLRLRQVAELVKGIGPGSVVDLGCATGQLRQLCPGIEYVGCDFVAPRAPVSFTHYQCDFNRERLPADLRELEAIVCSGVLEYIADLRSFLAQLRSRLVPGGHLVATYFNMNHLSRIGRLLLGRSFPVRPDWRGFYSPREFMLLLRGAGFEIERSVAMNHSLRTPAPVEQTLDCPMRLRPLRAWSALLAHQVLVVARRGQHMVRPVEEIGKVLPQGSTFILIDETQMAQEDFGGRQPVPFLEKDGGYWGPPPDSETAIQECERLRQAGAGFLVIIEPCFWWLEHYPEFASHLRSHFPCLMQTDSLVIFQLRATGPL